MNRFPKSHVESCAIALDLLHPAWKEALADEEPSSGSSEWHAGGQVAAAARWLLDAQGEDEARELQLALLVGNTVRSCRLAIEPVRVGFSPRWYARCPGTCGGRARKLYWREGRGRFSCWRCSGLQYRSAAKHNAREGKLVKDPEALLAALERANLRGRPPAMHVMRALERQMPTVFAFGDRGSTGAH